MDQRNHPLHDLIGPKVSGICVLQFLAEGTQGVLYVIAHSCIFPNDVVLLTLWIFSVEIFRSVMKVGFIRNRFWNWTKEKIKKQSEPYPAPIKIAEVSTTKLHICSHRRQNIN